jgi:hypothetical protein
LAAVFRAPPHTPQTPQVTPPVGAGGVPRVNPSVDRRTRNVTTPIVGEIAPRTPGDLVGRPILPQPLAYIAGHFGSIQLAHPRPAAASRFRLGLGGHGPIAVAAAIATQFTGNGGGMPAQPTGNLHLLAITAMHLGYHLAFLKGKMTCHRGDSVQKGCFLK